VAWDTRTSAVVAHRVRRLDALVLDDQPLRNVTPDALRAAMLEGIRSLGLSALPWTRDLDLWRQRVAVLRANLPPNEAAEWPDVADAALLATLEEWLAPWLDGITRKDHLSRIDLRGALHGMLDWNRQRQLDDWMPTHLNVPSGSRIAIEYAGGVPKLSVRLQEVFGLMESPRVAKGRVPVTMELLSPARRPVQVTQDLASFWARTYQDVKKELKGRYPKHFWPDDPYSAPPTRKVRPPGER
jgi:ATP-dependent helicase HrpB